jgi:flagellar hook protein FlgE
MGSLYTAISGLQASSRWLDVISNNVSNSNTVGFKYARVSFGDLISEGLVSASGSSSASNLGGINPSQLGLGVQVQSIDEILTQGTLQTTGNPTDVAISGDGFFTVKSGSATIYTRAGNFTFDDNGNMVTNTGGLVQGWSRSFIQTSTGAPIFEVGSLTSQLLTSGTPSNIVIPRNLVLGSLQTSNNNAYALLPSTKDSGVILKGNLDSKTNPPAVLFGAAGLPTAAAVSAAQQSGVTITSTVYDSLGTAHTITFLFEQIAAVADPAHGGTNAQAQWVAKAFDTTGGQAPSPNNYITGADLGFGTPLTFNGDGSVQNNGTGGLNNWSITDQASLAGNTTPQNAFNTGGFTFTVNLGTPNGFPAVTSIGQRDGLTGDYGNGTFNSSGVYQGVSTAYTSFVDGYSEGTLTGVSVDQTGDVICQFSNNQTVKMATLALTKFSNPAGLQKVGSTDFMQTANSGFPQTGIAGGNGFGTTQGGALEQSNVDLTTELSNMLVAQKMFESNARIVDTANSILNTLVQMAR